MPKFPKTLGRFQNLFAFVPSRKFYSLGNRWGDHRGSTEVLSFLNLLGAFKNHYPVNTVSTTLKSRGVIRLDKGGIAQIGKKVSLQKICIRIWSPQEGGTPWGVKFSKPHGSFQNLESHVYRRHNSGIWGRLDWNALSLEAG